MVESEAVGFFAGLKWFDVKHLPSEAASRAEKPIEAWMEEMEKVYDC